MRVEVARGAVGLLPAGRILEDEKVVFLALLENRIDVKFLSPQCKDEGAGRDLVAGHAEDVRDRDRLGRVVGLEARLHAIARIGEKVLKTEKMRSRVRGGISYSNSKSWSVRGVFTADCNQRQGPCTNDGRVRIRIVLELDRGRQPLPFDHPRRIPAQSHLAVLENELRRY